MDLIARLTTCAILASLALVVTGSAAQAGFTPGGCLAQKQHAWGGLRKCQAGENAKLLQGKTADLAKCQTKFDAKLAKISEKATAASVACRYAVNGDGTATDYDTGLQWEQKTDDGSVHDTNNLYTWSDGGGGYSQPDGTAFKEFLGTLNNGTSDGKATSGCFAGHCDWRLPALEELQTILVEPYPCGTSPCIDQTVFGATAAWFYWSASTFPLPGDPHYAWYVHFLDGTVNDASKDLGGSVRGVRSGL